MPYNHKSLIFANRISFLVAGFGIAAWAPMIPYIKERFMLNENDLGILLFCVAIGSLVAMPSASYLSAKIGCKLINYIATLILSTTLILASIIDNIYLMALNLFFFGVGAITVDVVSNVNSALVEKVINKSIMSSLHGLYSVGGLLGSLIVTFLLSNQLNLILVASLVAISLSLMMFIGGKALFTTIHIDNDENKHNQKSNGNILKYYTHPIILSISVMCFIMFMTEGSILDWSGVFLKQERNLSIEYAGYGYASFAIMMTICRLLGDKIVSKLGQKIVIISGTIFIMLGYLTIVLMPNLISAFIGFALIGVGASNVVPQLISFVAKVKEVPVHISITLVNAIGFTGILIGPALIGFLAQKISLPSTFLLQALLIALVSFLSFKTLNKH